MSAVGCSKKHHRYKHPTFVTERDVVGYLQIALEGELPDERREAVNEIARTKYLGHQVVMDGLDVIARTDTSPSVRCAALMALRTSGIPEAASTYTAVLNEGSADGQSRSAPAEIRRDALRGGLCLLEVGTCPDESQDALRAAAIRFLAENRSRDIRLLSAQVLAYIQHRDVLKPLIDALDQRDFGVVYESERSLMRLTGMTFDHDSVAWREWLAGANDPFAEAGRLDPILDQQEKGWWHRSMDSMQRTFASFRPKPERS